MITLDSSAIIAALDVRDPDHSIVLNVLESVDDALIIPTSILSEVSYFVEHRLGQRTLALFIEDIVNGSYTLDCGDEHWIRVQELVRRYHDLPLGLADAAVISCAERHGGRVLTLDRRHFGAVEREGAIQVFP